MKLSDWLLGLFATLVLGFVFLPSIVVGMRTGQVPWFSAVFYVVMLAFFWASISSNAKKRSEAQALMACSESNSGRHEWDEENARFIKNAEGERGQNVVQVSCQACSASVKLEVPDPDVSYLKK